jgi:two-component system sensor histidine kinase TctE
MVNLLVPAATAAIALGIAGAAVIGEIVDAFHDRILDGSVLAIAERLAIEDGEVTVDLPPVALGMLESQARDNIYYSVSHAGRLVTGYQDLDVPGPGTFAGGTITHRDAHYHGMAVRVAAQARSLYGESEPVIVQVAETTNGRRALEQRLLAGLGGLEALLIGLSAWLAWIAVGRGLAPLAELGRDIDRRSARGAVSLQPVPLATVPQELLPLVTAFNALLERLDQSIGAIRRFTADASHQMRTPLTVLRTHLSLLRRQGLATPDGQAALDDAEGGALRLERLIAQLLALARADQEGGDGPALDRIDLAAVAAETTAERVPQAVEAGVELGFERNEDVPAPLVRGTDLLLRELIGNLVDNAIRYGRRGGAVAVRVAEGANGPRIEIEDDGPGIPLAERARVFERFYRRAQTAQASEGSGIGLAIVRAIADRIGAHVALLDPTKGTGLLVVVTFPPATGEAPR